MIGRLSLFQFGQAPTPNVRSRSTWLSFNGLLLVAFLAFDFILLSIWGFGGDWSPLWVAGRLSRTDPGDVYDFALVSTLQIPIIGDLGVRPFVYPPTALLLLAGLSFIPFWISFGLFSAVSSATLAWATPGEEADRILLLASPPVLFAAMIGQPTLLVAALVAVALSALKSRKIVAGVLFALAAMFKPTLLVMAPAGLIAAREWRVIASGTVTASAILLASLLLFGVAPWLGWLDALSRFRDVFDASPWLYRNGITPHAFFLTQGCSGDWLPFAMLPVAVIVTAAAFIRTDDWTVRLVAMVGGALLASPYAMNYELAALAPAVFLTRRQRIVDYVVPLIWATSLFFNLSLIGLLAMYGWAVLKLFVTAPRGAGASTSPTPADLCLQP